MLGHPNATAATIAGAISVVVLVVLGAIGVDMPNEQAEELGVAITTLVTVIVLLIPGRKGDA